MSCRGGWWWIRATRSRLSWISGRAYGTGGGAARTAYAEEVEPPQPFHLFRTELTEVVRTYAEDATYPVVQVWKPGEPVRTLKRA